MSGGNIRKTIHELVIASIEEENWHLEDIVAVLSKEVIWVVREYVDDEVIYQ